MKRNMELPVWRITCGKVLHSIYEYSGWYSRGRGTSIIKHPLAGKLDISQFELDNHIRWLQNQGLIEDGDDWTMAAKGFDVALQNERMENDSSVRDAIAIFAGVSAFVMVM